ncbi:MAG: nucleoside-diphosphate kinase, partial [Candidatus Nanoarchaeia archaeon]|nr:nucleoside-diphosphate kinase [Candidatus Nanoarchaeia archaeon]
MTIQRSLVLIKPDGVQRGLSGEIIKRIEQTGLKIIAMKMFWANEDFAKTHYFDVGERHGERILKSLVNYLTEGPVIAICFEGVDAIAVIRKLAGSTYPNEALP